MKLYCVISIMPQLKQYAGYCARFRFFLINFIFQTLFTVTINFSQATYKSTC